LLPEEVEGRRQVISSMEGIHKSSIIRMINASPSLLITASSDGTIAIIAFLFLFFFFF
jgi:hypothetical protein